MVRSSLAAALALAAVGFGTATEAKAQYTVYIWNLNRNDGWVRSGVAGTVFTTKQACLNNISARVAENKRFRTDWEAFAVVRTTQRPNPGFLNRQNVPGGWVGQVRYHPHWNPQFRAITVKHLPAAPRDNRLHESAPRPLVRREADAVC